MTAMTAAQTETPTADIVDVAARLRLSATRLARQLRQQSGIGLSPSQLSALAAVHRDGPLTLGALADEERVAPPTITKVIGKLEEQGLVGHTDRCGGPQGLPRRDHDRPARRCCGEIRERKDAWLTNRLAALEPADRERLAAALDALELLTAKELS